MSQLILVATDGTPQSLGALEVARRLEERDGARIEVVTVIEPVPIYDTGFMVALPEAELFDARKETVEREVRLQLNRVTGSPQPWPLHLESGVPTSRIVGMAEELGADRILIGLGRHGSLERLFGRETALQVIRLAPVPVMAVPEDVKKLPNRAVMAVDFSTFSMRAAREALGVLKSPAHLFLVHTISGLEFVPTASTDWHAQHLRQLTARLEAFAADLDLPEGWTVTVQVLEGEPAHEILQYADAQEADILVAGSHGHSFMGRLLMGSVSTRLIRGSQRPVFVVPPPEFSEDLAALSARPEEEHPWEALMDGFSRRNAGRRTELEMDHPRLGAQRSGRNFPLWGVVYEPRGDRVEIMLGEQGSVDHHLTHSIPSPRSIEILEGEDGRDQALRIELDEGCVRLRFLDD